MSFSFAHTSNELKNALISKKQKIHLKYSKKQMNFVKFLLQNRVISGITQKNKIITIYPTYNRMLSSALSSFSINKKHANQKSSQFYKNLKSNMILTLTHTKQEKKYNLLLARFR